VEDAGGVQGRRPHAVDRRLELPGRTSGAPRSRDGHGASGQPIELHPYFQNGEVDAYGRAHRVAAEAWAPIAQAKVLDDPALKERLGKTVAQVVLHRHIERRYIVFLESVRPARIKENFELFDFELEAGPAVSQLLAPSTRE
jgi:hypothetical protein